MKGVHKSILPRLFLELACIAILLKDAHANCFQKTETMKSLNSIMTSPGITLPGAVIVFIERLPGNSRTRYRPNKVIQSLTYILRPMRILTR